MKSCLFFKIFYILTFLIVIINLILFVNDSFSFSIDDLPQGSYEYSVASPDNKKKADVYLVSNSLGDAVRIQISENGKTENVFWQTDVNEVSLNWENESVISVNDMQINVSEGGYYDCRLGVSIMLEGSLEPGVQE